MRASRVEKGSNSRDDRGVPTPSGRNASVGFRAADAVFATSADDRAGLRISVSSLARRLGVASSTLRTWERRYGIGPTEHESGRHRRYSSEDVARLECMQRALADGATPAEAARFAINLTATESSEIDHPAAMEFDVNSMKQIDELHENSSRTREMVDALRGKDAFTLQSKIADSIVADGVRATWRSAIVPLMSWVSSARHDGDDMDAAEQVLAQCISSAMAVAMIESPVPHSDTKVVIATVSPTGFDLELRALGAALARESIDVAMVPRRASIGSHAADIVSFEPGVVVLWSPFSHVAVVPLLRAIRRRRPDLQIFVAGRGPASDYLPSTVGVLGEMDSAVDALVCALR